MTAVDVAQKFHISIDELSVGKLSIGSSLSEITTGELVDISNKSIDTDDDILMLDANTESSSQSSGPENLRDILMKPIDERNIDDFSAFLEMTKNISAFCHFTTETRREMARKMVLAQVEKAGTVILLDGEILDSWCVILNGLLKTVDSSGRETFYKQDDSFGVEPNLSEQKNSGQTITLMDDCQFALLSQQDYVQIFEMEQKNVLRRYDSRNNIVCEMEKRTLENGKTVELITKATPDYLQSALLNKRDYGHEPNYIEDFLLVRRIFLPNAEKFFQSLLHWFENGGCKERIARIILLWVNNHFSDFETCKTMLQNLLQFSDCLLKENMKSHRQLLHIACSAKSRPRVVILKNDPKNERVDLEVLQSKPNESRHFFINFTTDCFDGLLKGDEILSINDIPVQNMDATKIEQILQIQNDQNQNDNILVKWNLLDFYNYIDYNYRSDQNEENVVNGSFCQRRSSNLKYRNSCHESKKLFRPLSMLKNNDTDSKVLNGEKSIDNRELMNRIGKFLRKFTHVSNSFCNTNDDNKPLNKRSSVKMSRSNPDLSIHSVKIDQNQKCNNFVNEPKNGKHILQPDSVMKIYRADQSSRYLPIFKETTAQSVIQLALQEFELYNGQISSSSFEYCLCEVSVDPDGTVKQKILPPHQSDLLNRLTLNSRYYLKNVHSTEPLISNQSIIDLRLQSRLSILNLTSGILAAQLTLRDHQKLASIDPVEYIQDIMPDQENFSDQTSSKIDDKNISKLTEFETTINEETWWVVSEVCREKNDTRRIKILKKFIKLAQHCRDFKNYNTLFAILCGLDKPAVRRLRSSWEKLPAKHKKILDDLRSLLNPSRNMAEYRRLLRKALRQPPCLPLLPVLRKDLYFIHQHNLTWVDEAEPSLSKAMVNYEKLRMIAKEVRQTSRLASVRYDMKKMLKDLDPLSNLTKTSILAQMNSLEGALSLSSSAVATLRRPSAMNKINLARKKVYEQHLMIKQCQAYLDQLKIIEDENLLDKMSEECEKLNYASPAQKINRTLQKQQIDSKSISSFGSSMSILSDKSQRFCGRAFGTESPDSINKMLSLSIDSRVIVKSSPSLDKNDTVSLSSRAKLFGSNGFVQNLNNESSSVTGNSYSSSSVFYDEESVNNRNCDKNLKLFRQKSINHCQKVDEGVEPLLQEEISQV